MIEEADRLNWWKEKGKNNIRESLWKVVKSHEEGGRERWAQYAEWLGLFTGRAYNEDLTFTRHVSRPAKASKVGDKRRIAFNVCRSAILTLAARICSVKPRPRFLTSGGQWSIKRRAMGFEKFIEGQMDKSRFHLQARKAFFDALITEIGYIKFWEDGTDVHCERVFPGEVYVDEQATQFAEPRVMYHMRPIAEDVLIDLFPKQKKSILQSQKVETYNDVNVMSTRLVKVAEGWHLPTPGTDAPGRHLWITEHATLVDEECDDLPFICYRFSDSPVGHRGQGLIEEAEGPQDEFNELLVKIQRAMETYTQRVFYEEGSIDKGKMTNHPHDMVGVKKTAGRWPETRASGSMPGQTFEHAKWIRETMYEQFGVSQLTASGKKPAGVESGRAMRTLLDTEHQRFALPAGDYEQLYVEGGRRFVKLGAKVFKHSGDYKVNYIAKDFIKSINWSDVALEEESYILKCYPANALPQDPAGRLEWVAEMLEIQLIDQPTAKQLFDFPDIEKHQSLENAAMDDLDRVIETMLLDNKFIPPQKYQGLEMGIRKMTSALLRAEMDGAPPEVLDNFKVWIAQAAALIEEEEMKAQQKAIEMQMALSQPTPPGAGGEPGPEAGPPAEAAPPGPGPMLEA